MGGGEKKCEGEGRERWWEAREKGGRGKCEGKGGLHVYTCERQVHV